MKTPPTNILLIEDDPEDAQLMKDMLGQARWPGLETSLTCVSTLESGLKLLDPGDVDVVLLDLMLPDSRGVEGVDRLHRAVPEVPLVVLTGLYDEALGLEAVRRGAQDYLVKGAIDARIIRRAISFAVERNRLRARLQAILDSASDGMVVIDAAGQVRFANPAAAAMLGKPLEDLIGRPFPLLSSTHKTVECRLPVREGGERYIEVRVKEMEWNDQAARLATLRDVTEPRLLQQRKEELLRRLGTERLSD